MLSLPTEEGTIEAFRKVNIRPSGRIFSGYTSKSVHCGCALAAVARANGQSVDSIVDAVQVFGETASRFMAGWDYPGFEGYGPDSKRGASCWWACVKAGLIPSSIEILNSDWEHAPGWVKGNPYTGPTEPVLIQRRQT